MIGVGAVLCLTATAWSAEGNLVVNSGFEAEATGWSGLWTRDAGVGTVTLAPTAAHEGRAGLHLEHNGPQDWSYQQTAAIAAEPGDVFRLGGWVRVESVAGSVDLSVILRDASGEVLSWSYGGVSTTRAHDWRRFERRFAIGARGAEIVFRVMGAGPAVADLDDLLLVREGNLSEMRKESQFAGLDLEAAHLRVRLAPDLGASVLDKRIGYAWLCAPGPSPYVVLSATKTDDGATLRLRDVLTETESTVRIMLRDVAAPGGRRGR